MTNPFDDENGEYLVLVNDEGQHSLWPGFRDVPAGWAPVGPRGARGVCLEYIEQNWLDMRPKSLVAQMESGASEAVVDEASASAIADGDPRTLVDRLCEREHPVEVSLRPERTAAAFKQCVDRGYVHLRFTDTRGGTELGFGLDRTRSEISAADFEAGRGSLKLVGDLTLDFVPVRCTANVDLSTMRGAAILERC